MKSRSATWNACLSDKCLKCGSAGAVHVGYLWLISHQLWPPAVAHSPPAAHHCRQQAYTRHLRMHKSSVAEGEIAIHEGRASNLWHALNNACSAVPITAPSMGPSRVCWPKCMAEMACCLHHLGFHSVDKRMK